MSVLIFADAFTGDTLHEDRYYFGAGAPYLPALVQAGGQEGPYGSSSWGPWTYGGILYTMLENSSIYTGIYQSIDDGVTWTELDSANHILSGVSTPHFDGDHTVTVAWLVPAGPIKLRDFDLATGLWGSDYVASGAPADCTQLGMVIRRVDNTIFVLYDTAPPAPTAPVSNMKGAVYSGGSWITGLDIGANMSALPGWVSLSRILTSQACSVMDPSGRLHFVFVNDASNLSAYQAVELDNSLGTFHRFTDALQVWSGTSLGHPVIIGSSIVIPASVRLLWPSTDLRNCATVFVGTPLSAPTFTLLPVPGIDPNDADWLAFGVNYNQPSNVPVLVYDGTTLYALWPREDSDGSGNKFAQLRLASTTSGPTTGWSAATIFDIALDSPLGFNIEGQEIQIPSIGVYELTLPSKARVTQAVTESIGGDDIVETTQAVTETVGSPDGIEVSQVVIESIGSSSVVFTEITQVVIEVLGGFGNIRATQTVIEIIAGDPVPRNITIFGNRGRISSLRTGGTGYVTVEGLETSQLYPVVPINPVDVVFRPVRTRLAARYSGSQIVDILDGRPSFIAPWVALRLTSDPTDQITNVLAGEEGRLDIISLQMYGREDLWWCIAQANDIQNPFEEPLAGDRIRIPSLSRILRLLGQVGTGTEPNRFTP